MNSSATASNGHWVTINGAKVYIEDGKVTKGPSHLIGGEVEGHRFRKATADDVVAQKRKDAEHRLPPPGEQPEMTATYGFSDRAERQTRKSHEQEPFHLVDMPIDMLTSGNKVFSNRMERQNAIGGSPDPGFTTIDHKYDGTPVYNVDDGNHRVEHARRSGKKTVPMYVKAFEPEHLEQLKSDLANWHSKQSASSPESRTTTLSASQILAIRQRAKSFGRAVASVGGELGTIGDMQINLSNDQHVPAGSPQGGQFASKGTVNERDVSKLMKDLRGVQAMTQKRATHNEVAPNGETYRGGAFIATTEMPKKIRQKLEQQAAGKGKPSATNLSAPSPYYLSASGDISEAANLSAELPKDHNGEPIFYAWQDAALCGKWKHPTKGFELDITPARVSKWVDRVNLALSRNVDLPLVEDHKETARSTLGYIRKARQNPDNGRLELLNGYIGEDAYKIAKRNKLSVGIDPNFKDSFGNEYGEAIRHCAITPIPVISGQQGFLAASRDGQQEPEYLIPVAKDNKDMTLTDEQRKEICDVLGVEHVDDDAAISLLTATVTDLQNECLTLSAAKDESAAKLLELSAAEPVIVEPSKADPELVKTKIELSAARGDITKHLADGLNKLIDSEPLLLSREGDGKPAIVLKFLELFDGAKLGAKSVERTGVQMLSREVPDGEKKTEAKVNPWKSTIDALNSTSK